ncbi:MAG TPA: ChaN family lipoprotein [Azospirillum sp.]|nr:ChaN family lipoprotein [Azospirillum sp.]
MPLRPYALLLPLLLLGGCVVSESHSAPAPAPPAEAAPVEAAKCVPPGTWADAAGKATPRDALLERAAKAPAVLLGERHDSAEQHRWQLQTLSQLYGLNAKLAVAMEMVPRSKQAVLDRWVDGTLSEADFLREVDWRTVWGFDPQLYLPILHFARMNRLPLVAINVEQDLVRRTSRGGWASIPEAEREGVGTAAPPSAEYRDFLAKVLGQHGPEEQAVNQDTERFRNFVEAQSVWDRAMAERIAETHRKTGRTVVTIVGAGHVQNRFGIPHQLADLGIPDSVVLLPWDADRPCRELDGKIADAVFGIDSGGEPSGPPKPRFGVMLEPDKAGVKVADVLPGSVAEATGLKRGDIVTAAAGKPVRVAGDLTGAVQKTGPGTWLPVTVKRGGKTKDLVAKFPAE